MKDEWGRTGKPRREREGILKQMEGMDSGKSREGFSGGNRAAFDVASHKGGRAQVGLGKFGSEVR